MALSFVSSRVLSVALLLISQATAFTGSEYRLTHEYSGANFFDGWDFYTGRDPTGGFVTFYSRSSAQLTDLIRTSENGPAYMGVNSIDTLPFNNATGQGDGAGRPSVRIASKQAFTHGLFIADFEHTPAGVCGTWPAYWTLGPNWPYTGEIDILEGVNQNDKNIMSLHTNETCLIEGDTSVMTGTLGNTNCAYYPDYKVGCGVKDTRTTSFGVGFNQAGGGVYAMQWTSESILVWQWIRDEIPDDVNSKNPDPGSWGLPVAQLAVGNCSVDQHFQSHKIIFDTTFCGEYAGNPYVWKTDESLSCADSTGLKTCDNFVANNPTAFEDAYWSVNYVRVFDLVDPDSDATPTSYIASEQPRSTAVATVPSPIPTLNLATDKLCPKYNFSVISDGKYDYEVACDFDPPGPDINGQPYPGFTAKSMGDCVKGCAYMNENNEVYRRPPKYRPGYNEIRLICYGYPQVTDDPRSIADSTASSVFLETIPIPQTYRPLTSTSRPTVTTTTGPTVVTATETESVTLPPALGGNTTTSSISMLPSDYSETVTEGVSNSTSATTTSEASSVTSTDPEATKADFYIVFNVENKARRLAKREVNYLAFDSEGRSVLVTNQVDATKFHLSDNGTLMAGDQFVVFGEDAETTQFVLSDQAPAKPVTLEIEKNGTVKVAGADGYCATPEGTLQVLQSDGEPPSGCLIVDPNLVSAPATSSSTSSTSTSTRSTSSTNISTTSSNSRSTITRSVTLDTPTAITSSTSTSGLTSSSNTRSSVSTSSSSLASDQTSSRRSSTSSTLTTTSSATKPSSTRPIINDFIYAGCFGVPTTRSPASLPGVSIPLTSDDMTNEKCIAACKSLDNAYFAATHETNCLCSTSLSLYSQLLNYTDSSCNAPCPGANRQFCGGTILASSSSVGNNMIKRQDTSVILISLYNNTLLLPSPNAPPTTTTPSSPTTTSLYFPAEDISYIITGTNTATVISTTYTAICPVCPGGLTTSATTITVPHCGCTASYEAHLQSSVPVPSPALPMTTTVHQCACGPSGVQSTVTLTVPHTSSISQLAAAVTQMAIDAAAALGPGAGGAALNQNLAAAAAKPGQQSQSAGDYSSDASDSEDLGDEYGAPAMGSPGNPSPAHNALNNAATKVLPTNDEPGQMPAPTDIAPEAGLLASAAGATARPPNTPGGVSGGGNATHGSGRTSSQVVSLLNNDTAAPLGTGMPPLVQGYTSGASSSKLEKGLLSLGVQINSIGALFAARYSIGVVVGVVLAGLGLVW